MTIGLTLPARLYQAAVLGLAALIGLMAGLEPRYAIAAAVGLAFVALIMSDLTIGLCLFTAVAFLEALPYVFGGLSFAKVVGALLALSWFASVATRPDTRRQFATTHPLLLAAILLLVVWCGTTVLWAEEIADVIDGTQRWALNLALFPIVYAALKEPKHLRWMFAVFIFGALFSALAGMAGIFPEGDDLDEGRLSGAGLNPNQLGGLLVVATAMAISLILRREARPLERGIWFAAAGLCLLGLLATVSRGALLGGAVAVLLAPLFAGHRRRLATLAVALAVVAAAAVWIVALAPQHSVDRLTRSDRTGSGRTDIWTVGLRMVDDNLYKGVGVGNYQEASIKYVVQPGVVTNDEYVVNRQKVAHNIYLHVQAEIGLVGFSLFMGIIGFCVVCVLRAASRFAARGDVSSEMMARALCIALIGLLAASFFSSQFYSKQLWLLLAACPAALAVARSAGESR